jgi:hypothetical protein
MIGGAVESRTYASKKFLAGTVPFYRLQEERSVIRPF